MCFALQRRALFPHLNFQKWSEHGVLCAFWLGNVLRHNAVHFFDITTSKSVPKLKCFCTFWLGNVLCATTACTFPTSQLPKVVWAWCALRTLTWKCASHHNGVQLFISHLASGLRTRRFSEPTFRPSGATWVSPRRLGRGHWPLFVLYGLLGSKVACSLKVESPVTSVR